MQISFKWCCRAMHSRAYILLKSECKIYTSLLSPFPSNISAVSCSPLNKNPSEDGALNLNWLFGGISLVWGGGGGSVVNS